VSQAICLLRVKLFKQSTPSGLRRVNEMLVEAEQAIERGRTR